MSKSARLTALKSKIDEVIKSPIRRFFTKVLLWMFIKGFKIKAYYKDATGLARAWYIFIALPLFLYGYVLDVCINQTVGKKQFGDAWEFGTLTATMWRVKKLGSEAQGYDFSVQICLVLSDYDPGHC